MVRKAFGERLGSGQKAAVVGCRRHQADTGKLAVDPAFCAVLFERDDGRPPGRDTGAGDGPAQLWKFQDIRVHSVSPLTLIAQRECPMDAHPGPSQADHEFGFRRAIAGAGHVGRLGHSCSDQRGFACRLNLVGDFRQESIFFAVKI